MHPAWSLSRKVILMNHNCHGDFFTVEGKQYYCCFADSSVVKVDEKPETCLECGRSVSAIDTGECETEVRTFVKIPERGTVEMPNDR